jgi:hypothetical protein
MNNESLAFCDIYKYTSIFKIDVDVDMKCLQEQFSNCDKDHQTRSMTFTDFISPILEEQAKIDKNKFLVIYFQ